MFPCQNVISKERRPSSTLFRLVVAGGLCFLFDNSVAASSSKPVWKSVRLEPEGIALSSPGTSQHFVITGTDSEGTEKDVTNSCRVTSSNPKVVDVDLPKSLLIGRSPGHAEIRISFGQRSSFARVTVGNLPTDMTVRFSPDIISILQSKGATAPDAMGLLQARAGFKLSLFGYDVEADHQMIVKGMSGRRVNLEHPGRESAAPETFVCDPARRGADSSRWFGRIPDNPELAEAGSPPGFKWCAASRNWRCIPPNESLWALAANSA